MGCSELPSIRLVSHFWNFIVRRRLSHGRKSKCEVCYVRIRPGQRLLTKPSQAQGLMQEPEAFGLPRFLIGQLERHWTVHDNALLLSGINGHFETDRETPLNSSST